MAHDVKITGNKKKGYVATCQEPECYWMNLGHLVLNRAGIEAKAREHQENMERYNRTVAPSTYAEDFPAEEMGEIGAWRQMKDR